MNSVLWHWMSSTGTPMKQNVLFECAFNHPFQTHVWYTSRSWARQWNTWRMLWISSINIHMKCVMKLCNFSHENEPILSTMRPCPWHRSSNQVLHISTTQPWCASEPPPGHEMLTFQTTNGWHTMCSRCRAPVVYYKMNLHSTKNLLSCRGVQPAAGCISRCGQVEG